ncbi:hypothetical protein H2201_004283 [Coniosporium apollinis]|uniref:DUF7514 domain-containing protein n=1 Tax=Coniosporium apollinis TaxID=61459 RepID=A0ABQ9NVB6_9PEZI|nr:hypothetical protein H2201_004283 [Coniosporium apollinis]
MAYNPSEQPPYSPSFDYPDPRLYQNPASYPQQPRSRASSTARPDGPVSDAVNNAFHNSDAASHVDPRLIAQITEEVRRQVIDSLNFSGGPYEGRNYASPFESAAFAKSPPPNQPQQSYVHRSSTSSTTASYPPRDVYTPPSPHRYDHPDRSSPSPPLSQESASFSSFVSREEEDRRYPTTEPPPPAANTSRLRPAAVPRAATEEWMSPPASALEKAYGKLFDEYDQPTPRLGQLLRGLAIHIIEDYEPKNSLVITPAKMLKFYEETRLNDEIYPWNKIFASLPNSSISKMYRDLKCQHHFVQDQYSEVPHLPALTPLGFQSWMTVMIQAHPETEYNRIAKAVLNMPISNADDKQERFPKELSRRLFPMQENMQARQRCAAALSADGNIPVPKSTPFPPPPPTQPPPQSSGSFERKRQPYGGQTDSNRTDSVFEPDDIDDRSPPTIPIERERKPYVAKEGCGKIHEDVSNSTSSLKPDSTSRHHRSNSTGQGTSARDNQPRPAEYNQSGISSSRQYRPQSNMNAGRRPRSPTGGFARSEGSNISDIPASEFSSNIYSAEREEDNRKFAKDAEMKRNEWARRHAEEDAARGPYMGRSPTYEEDYYRSRGMSTGNMYGAYGGYPPPPPRY